MSEEKYAALKLENQLCFPLYACSKEIIRKYKPILDELELTYTQYLALLVLWEREKISVKELGERLLLDSGTLTPVLKSLERKGYVRRERSAADERALCLRLTESGLALKERALDVPRKIAACGGLTKEEGEALYVLLYKFLAAVTAEEKR